MSGVPRCSPRLSCAVRPCASASSNRKDNALHDINNVACSLCDRVRRCTPDDLIDQLFLAPSGGSAAVGSRPVASLKPSSVEHFLMSQLTQARVYP